ncbi:MAG: hypothetical protein GY898_26245, partial [Proteobacteria bacterium]|nr:hypothetical protein [Pseudomonadota bacterium]
DDDIAPDDDDTAPDDDDVAPDDDDGAPDDDDVAPDDDDTAPDDDDTAPDDDDTGPEPCVDDALEDNDDFANALAAAVGFTAALRLCDGDDDWYTVFVDAGDTLTVDVLFSQAEGDIDLLLRDSAGSLIAEAATATDNESVIHAVTVSTTFYIEVILETDLGSLPGNDYDLDISVATTVGCVDDAFEPNDDLVDATPTSDGTQTGLALCDTSLSDYFVVFVESGDTLEVDLLFSDAAGNIDLFLIDSGGNDLISSESTTDDELISYVAPASDTYYIQAELTSDDSTPGNGYDLLVFGTTSPCTSDSYEPNDAPFTAAGPLAAGAYPGLHACLADEDWFEIDLTAGEELTVDLSFAHIEGDIDMEVFDSAANSVGLGNSSTDNESVTYTAATTGTYLLQVLLFSDSGSVVGNPYDLDVAITPPPACPSDSLEPNDSQITGAPVTDGSYPGLSACTGDDDWYLLELLAGETLELDLIFSHAEGNIDVVVVDDLGNELASSSTTTDDESLSFTAPGYSLIGIEVILETDLGSLPGNSYDLEVLIEDAACVDDTFAGNDDLASAATLTPPTSETGLVLCDGVDEDWYELPGLTDTDVIDIAAAFDGAELDVNFFLYDGSDSLVASAQAVGGDSEELLYSIAAAGDHKLQIAAGSDPGGNGGVYDLEITITTAPTSCAVDTLEPNDTLGAAAPVLNQSYPTLSACSADSDWYSISASNGDTLGVDLAFTHAEGDINLFLVDSGGNDLDSSETTTDNESIAYSVTSNGVYFIEVVLDADTGGFPGNLYDMVISGTTESCTADAFEPNDSDAAAAAVTDGSYPGLHACQADDDWYELTLVAGETTSFDIEFTHAEGNIDAFFVDSVLAPLTSSTSITDDEEFSYTSPNNTTYYLRLELVADTGSVVGNPYSLTLASAAGCSPDGYEPNDSIAAASPISVGPTTGANACEFELDYYSFGASTSDVIDVGITFPHSEGNLDLFLYDDLGVEVASSESTTDDEAITYTALAGATYTIGVFNFDDTGPTAGNEYDISLAIAGASCHDDGLEPNDDSAEAVATPNGSYGGLTMCSDNFDWYSVLVSTGDIISTSIAFLHAEGDLDLEILNSVSSTVATSASTTDDESIVYTVATGGVHYIRVEMANDTGPQPGNRYDIDLAAYSATCPTDFAEPNDSDAAADLVEPPGYENLYVCSDDDWYEVVAPLGVELWFEVAFDHDEGDINAYLYDSGLTELDSGTSTDDNEEVFTTVASAGTFYLKVELATDTGPAVGNLYDVAVSGPTTASCPADFQEPNDSIGDAFAAGFSELPTAWACLGDDDYYAAYLFAGDAVEMLVELDDSEGNIDLELLDATGGVLGSSTTTTDEEVITYTAAANGFVYARVYLDSDTGNSPGASYLSTLALIP